MVVAIETARSAHCTHKDPLRANHHRSRPIAIIRPTFALTFALITCIIHSINKCIIKNNTIIPSRTLHERMEGGRFRLRLKFKIPSPVEKPANASAGSGSERRHT